MDRKIEITGFAHSTRLLFIRLLALVKWAASAGKVEKCASIVNFLDKQSMLFIETADMFAMLSRDTLVQARLPSFHIPCAAEILTTGTYSRLPNCIRDKIIPPDPISAEKKKCVLERLNRIIQYKLVTTDLPPYMQCLEIKRGRVLFRVENEFEVSLTLMGDGPQVPWRLLDMSFLVEDVSAWDCSKSLVHPLQISYIHQLVQSHICDDPRPLDAMFECLHFFSLSLQLEVLHTQTVRLCRERFGDSVRIDEYTPGATLKLNFWSRHLLDHQQQPFSLVIHLNEEDPCKPLQVTHVPDLREEKELSCIEPNSGFLSIERLLIQTIHIRSRQRLSILRDNYFRELLPSDFECTLGLSPALLQIPLVHPCSPSEKLVLTVDTHTGYVQAFVPQYDEVKDDEERPPMIVELQEIVNALAKDPKAGGNLRSRLASTVLNLRLWIILKRCKRSLQHLPVLAMEHNPVMAAIPDGHPLNRMGKFTLYVKLCKHIHYYVVIELQAASPSDHVHFKYYLMSVTEDNRLSTFNTLDKCQAHAGLSIDSDFLASSGKEQRKRPSSFRAAVGGGHRSPKKPRFSGYPLSEVVSVVAACDDRLPFSSLTRELGLRGICHRGVSQRMGGADLCVKIAQMPAYGVGGDIPVDLVEELRRCLLSCTFRLQTKANWQCELIFHDCPLITQEERNATRVIHLNYDFSHSNTGSVVDEWLADWLMIGKLYKVVLKFEADLKKDAYAALVETFEVRSFSYQRLTIAYGSERTTVNYTVTVYLEESRFRLVFGVDGPASAMNPHSIIAHQLSDDFNRHQSVVELLQTLRDTHRPLLSLSRLPSVPQLGVINSRPQVPVLTFMIIPQSSVCFRLVYRACCCLEIQCRRGAGCVIIRDGAFSHFDESRHVEDFLEIPALRAFLSKFSSSNEVKKEESDPHLPAVPLLPEGVAPFPSPTAAKTGSPASARSLGGGCCDDSLIPPRSSQHQTVGPPSLAAASPHPSPATFGGSTASPNPSFGPTVVVSTQSALAPTSPLAAPLPSSPYSAQQPNLSPYMTSSSPSPSAAASNPSSLPGPSSNDPTSPAFPILSASPANSWPLSPAPRPSSRQLFATPSLGGPSSADAFMRPPMSRSAPAGGGNWAAAIPIVVSHENLDLLCTPTSSGYSPIERALGCAFMRNTIHRVLTRGDVGSEVRHIQEAGVVIFRLDQLVYRVCLDPLDMQSLHVKITQHESATQQFSVEDIQMIERYFDSRVASIPFKPNAFISFTRLMNTPQRILRDFVQLMRLELCPCLNSRWSFQLCLTIPPAASPPLAPPGMTSVVINRNRVLFFFQLVPLGTKDAEPVSATEVRPLSIVVPLVYDLQTNAVSLATDRKTDAAGSQNSRALNLIASVLRRSVEYQNRAECSIYPLIRELVTQLTLD
ncbi:mediator of RNA polymerase II transcription subunit 14 [Galendromus occidentalis]|uniref:Mediator of RNA polymerase II transcription subunit 14 n=1 Tax=Galendromus occidentalis TaxID=34638 RepID=A0AAJ6QLW0_9ACAR|nr:mediator of RNA polymerase II transcription subunit 14 [Galendromus occidentalis]